MTASSGKWVLWMQREDFEVEKLGEMDEADALAAVTSYPWNERGTAYAEAPDDACPPGLGLEHADGRQARLFTTGPEDLRAHLRVPQASKLLGLIPLKGDRETEYDIPPERLSDWLDIFLHAPLKDLRADLARNGFAPL